MCNWQSKLDKSFHFLFFSLLASCPELHHDLSGVRKCSKKSMEIFCTNSITTKMQDQFFDQKNIDCKTEPVINRFMSCQAAKAWAIFLKLSFLPQKGKKAQHTKKLLMMLSPEKKFGWIMMTLNFLANNCNIWWLTACLNYQRTNKFNLYFNTTTRALMWKWYS